MLLNPINTKNLQRLIYFFSRENETGYVFAYAEQTSLISDINKEIINQFKGNNQDIALVFLEPKGDIPIISLLKEQLSKKNYQGIIVSNLYSYINDPDHGKDNLNEINFARESFYRLGVPILFWITQDTFPIISNKAADLYSQRRLAVIDFVKEQSDWISTSQIEALVDESPTTSNRLIFLKEQFEEARQKSLKGKTLVSEYLLPYLEELSKNFQKEETLSLLNAYEHEIETFKTKNTSSLARIYSNIHEYDSAIRLSTLVIEQELDLMENDQEKTPTYDLYYYHNLRGNNYREVGLLNEALTDYEQSQEVIRSLLDHSPDNENYKNGLAISYEKLGETHSALGNLEKALTYFEKDLELSKELYEAYPQNVSFKNGLAVSYSKLGETYSGLGNLDQALTYYEDQFKLGKELCEAHPQNVPFKNGLAVSYSKLGETHFSLGNLDQALTHFEDRFKLGKELYEAYPQNVSFKNGLAVSYSKLGETHSALGNLDQALTYFEDETVLFEELNEAYPQNVSFKNGLAVSYSKLGETHTSIGNLERALTYFEDETVLFEELYEAYPQNVSFKNGLAVSYSKLGETHSALGNLDQALTYFEDRFKLGKELYEAYPQNVSFKNGLAISYEKLGETHSELGNLDQALTYFEDETVLFEELYEAYPQNVSFKNGLMVSYSKLDETHSALGNLDQALTYFEKSIELSKELYEANPTNVSFKNGLAISFVKLGIIYLDHKSDKQSAKDWLLKAQNLWHEVVKQSPKNVQYQKNLDWVIDKIKQIEEE